MEETSFEVIVVGGGIGGSAAALRAAQYHLRTAWIRGDRDTARASRGKYVYNVDNMIGVHERLVRDKILDLLSAERHEEARKLLDEAHFHVGTQDIIDNVAERIGQDYSAFVEMVEEKAVAARREGGLFAVGTEGGRVLNGTSLVLATGCMDRQPRIRKTLRSGKVVDGIHWIYPYANHETLLYCIRCEGHLTRGTSTVVIGSSETTAQVGMMLHERYGTRVTILTNGEDFLAGEETLKLLRHYGIRVLSSRIADLLNEGKGRKGTSLRGFVLEDGTEVEARFGMVAMGLYRVYNDLARQLGSELDPRDHGPDERRHVLVEERTSETSVRGLFAVGDMSRTRGDSPSMKQIYTAQEYAVRAIDTIDRRRRRASREAILTGASEVRT